MTPKVAEGIDMVTLVSAIKTAVVDELKTAMIVEIKVVVGSEIKSMLAKILTNNHQQKEEVAVIRQRLDHLEGRVKQMEQRLPKIPVAAPTHLAETVKTMETLVQLAARTALHDDGSSNPLFHGEQRHQNLPSKPPQVAPIRSGLGNGLSESSNSPTNQATSYGSIHWSETVPFVRPNSSRLWFDQINQRESHHDSTRRTQQANYHVYHGRTTALLKVGQVYSVK
ncbi:unnamed protein product [Linum trigynum]|uniref:Uncharacterized protein n=1 Tax=Linum trigynum TaxID=586398 RepID=A0AAV2E7J1_9ROSI